MIGIDETILKQLVPKIVREGWSARAVEQYVVDIKGGHGEVRIVKAGRPMTAHSEVVEKLEKHFATPIQIKTTQRGSGRIVIQFKNKLEFERIARMLDD